MGKLQRRRQPKVLAKDSPITRRFLANTTVFRSPPLPGNGVLATPLPVDLPAILHREDTQLRAPLEGKGDTPPPLLVGGERQLPPGG